MAIEIIVQPRPTDQEIEIHARQLLAGGPDSGNGYVLDRAIQIAKHENLDVTFRVGTTTLTPDLAHRLRDRGMDIRRVTQHQEALNQAIDDDRAKGEAAGMNVTISIVTRKRDVLVLLQIDGVGSVTDARHEILRKLAADEVQDAEGPWTVHEGTTGIAFENEDFDASIGDTDISKALSNAGTGITCSG